MGTWLTWVPTPKLKNSNHLGENLEKDIFFHKTPIWSNQKIVGRNSKTSVTRCSFIIKSKAT